MDAQELNAIFHDQKIIAHDTKKDHETIDEVKVCCYYLNSERHSAFCNLIL
jgi:hypothetical protein